MLAIAATLALLASSASRLGLIAPRRTALAFRGAGGRADGSCSAFHPAGRAQGARVAFLARFALRCPDLTPHYSM